MVKFGTYLYNIPDIYYVDTKIFDTLVVQIVVYPSTC